MAAHAGAGSGYSYVSTFQKKSGLSSWICSINVNDPGLITLVNKLQDVFTTVGVCSTQRFSSQKTSLKADVCHSGSKPHRSTSDSGSWITIKWKELGPGEHSGERLVWNAQEQLSRTEADDLQLTSRHRNRHQTPPNPPINQSRATSHWSAEWR